MIDQVYPYLDKWPKIAEDAFIAPNATIIGDVTIGAESSIWFNTVIRGDVMPISIGDRSNLQDGTIVHVTGGQFSAIIGSDVLIGHRAIIHGAHLQDACFIGMAATILDGVVVETGSMVAAGSLVTPGKVVKEGELWAGSPAKFFRKLSESEKAELPDGADGYKNLGQQYRMISKE
ncbi:MAG: gamma carbonic anhydrase family protein [Pseudomonadota bacterium]|nr:gamma carbonic anhydrase family protein [Pseudomonadota bacterium]